MSIIAGISLGMGAAGALAGALGARKQAREREREIAKQEARNEAWYNRNDYGDYLNTVEAMNAVRRVNDTLRERSLAARARQVVAGGTPEIAVAQEAENARGVADLMGSLAAQGDAYRRDVDARKQQLDAQVSGARQAIADNRQAANAGLMSAGLRSVMNGLSQFDLGNVKLGKDKKV